MSAIVLDETIRIPAGITDLESFRRWARSDEYPEHGWYSFLKGELWADPSMERLIHNIIKTEIARVLSSLVKQIRSGRFHSDRMLLTNLVAGLSTEPDGMFVSFKSIKSALVRLVDGLDCLEVEGSPDMTLEVVSPTSVKKDTEVLPEQYWLAGVQEYWLVNALGERAEFEIMRSTSTGFVAVRQRAGWTKSTVFGKSFRLVEGLDELGEREFTLEVR